eukprot:GDKK01071911.1.p1 GENE.GDKK01071911.1~~GDKK01071911.1.p1  ORF type:complete len:425 (-),score=71.24 GDKK01071911.1:32-1135(-)
MDSNNFQKSNEKYSSNAINETQKREWLSDDVIRLDIAENIACNTHFFPFDGCCEHLCLSLVNDPTIGPNSNFMSDAQPRPHKPLILNPQDSKIVLPFHHRMASDSRSSPSFFPPSGVLPLPNLALFSGPFAFLHKDPAKIYPIFKAFYTRYLSRLHGISPKLKDFPLKYPECTMNAQKQRFDLTYASKNNPENTAASMVAARRRVVKTLFPDCTSAIGDEEEEDIPSEFLVREKTERPSELSPTLLGLLVLFERYMIMFLPDLKKHVTENLSISMLRIVLPWISSGFLNVLSPDQIFMLYDRIIGFDSLELLSLLCVAIFAWKKDLLLLCKNENDIRVALVDVGACRPIELIQMLLFVSCKKNDSKK